MHEERAESAGSVSGSRRVAERQPASRASKDGKQKRITAV
jgi:hypothetical protein